MGKNEGSKKPGPNRGVDRRTFVKAAGSAGILGAAGAASNAWLRPIIEPVVAQQTPGDPEFPPPEGLQPGAQLDSRFPVSFETPVQEGLQLVMEYFTALNRRDLERLADTLHFPFAIYEDIDPLVFETRSDFLADPPPTLNVTGRGTTRLMPGSYDIFESIDNHLYCPVGGVFSLAFTRWTPDGHKLLDCDGLFSVTNNDGRWGIQLVSTIFHERGYEGLEYPGGLEHDIVGSQGYMAQFGYRNEDVLDDPTTGRGRYQPPLPVGTRVASVSFGYGPRGRSRNARENRPMVGWRTEGVESRLNVSEVTPPGAPGSRSTNLDEFVDLAGGTVGDYGYTRIPPNRDRLLHATHDKIHTKGGYWRFTHEGELISETRSVGIRIYKEGRWGSAGGLGQVTHHDRSNSVG